MALITETQNNTRERSRDAAAFEREWRNTELFRTDWISQTPDHSERAAYLTYRQTLRDWPADSTNFPETRPTLSL